MSLAHEPVYPNPVVPYGDGGYVEVPGTGITYRQWLIGEIVSNLGMTFPDSDSVYRNAARACIRIADAVIAELNEE